MSKGCQIPLAPSELMARAREITGIELCDEAAVEPLAKLVAALNAPEAALHEKGAQFLQHQLLRILSNRLRMQRDFIAHPEIADETIEEPIIICGMGRTGSTKTQKLLANSGDFNWLNLWKSLNPAALTGEQGESVQPRIDDAQAFWDFIDTQSPTFKYGHPMSPEEPEEEAYILEHSLVSPFFMGWANIPSYFEWMQQQDVSIQFEYLKDSLKYLQWQGLASSSKRWLLKAVFYYGHEPLVLKYFPNACLVSTHRDPVPVAASAIQLTQLILNAYGDSAFDARTFFRGMAFGIGNHLQNRKDHPNMKLLDLDFREIVTSPDAVIRKVYTFAEAELSDASLQRMLSWNNNNPAHKSGKHRYKLEDFGLTEVEVNQAFAEYNAFRAEHFAISN